MITGLHIKRLLDSDKLQTLGELTVIGDTFKCKTMELEYNDNKKRISCIPAGTYIVKKRTSDKYKEHFHITDVPNRDFILIHNCNYSRELLGCIGVGESFIDLDKDGLKDITNSKVTLKKLYDLMPSEFKLTIE
jgi:hypothetical protein